MKKHFREIARDIERLSESELTQRNKAAKNLAET